jgi:hypothetical protein
MSKTTKPEEILKNHARLNSNIDLVNMLEEKSKGEITHCEVMVKNSKDKSVKLFQNKWEEIPLTLRNMEPHFPSNLKVSFFKVGLYIDTLKIMKLNWIGLTFKYPLLLHQSIPSW